MPTILPFSFCQPPAPKCLCARLNLARPLTGLLSRHRAYVPGRREGNSDIFLHLLLQLTAESCASASQKNLGTGILSYVHPRGGARLTPIRFALWVKGYGLFGLLEPTYFPPFISAKRSRSGLHAFRNLKTSAMNSLFTPCIFGLLLL